MMHVPVSFTVYPGECDTFGHLNQAAFLVLFERARWQLLAEGPGMDLFGREGVWPAVRRAVIEYLAPAFAGQELRFQQTVTRLGRTSFTIRQVARRASDDTLVATLESVFVCIDRGGAAVPVPPAVAAWLLPTAPPVTAPQRRVPVHGVELALDDRGSGPALLFLHGYPLDGTMWRHQAGAFPGWRTLVPDLRGLGRSDAPDLGYSMATYADDLAGLLDAIGVDEVVLAGLSMGGYVAFEFLRRHRPRVRGLVLADTRAQADSAEGRKGREVAMAAAREGGAPLIADQMLPRLLGPTAPESLRDSVRAMMASAPVAGILGALAAMRDRPDSTGLLPSLAGLPTLVVVGAEDQLTPPKDAEAIAKAIPGARLAVISHAGHLAPLEQPEAFNEHLRALLGRLEPAPVPTG
jgi:YbgC/YbaW family acyl-CoA thioester hydrolase